jgi:hypothetical protein
MNTEHQLKLNFDDPVEHLALPFYLRAQPHLENPNKPTKAETHSRAARVEIAPNEKVLAVIVVTEAI